MVFQDPILRVFISPRLLSHAIMSWRPPAASLLLFIAQDSPILASRCRSAYDAGWEHGPRGPPGGPPWGPPWGPLRNPTWPRFKTWRLSGFSPAWDLTMGKLTQKRATIFHPPISFLCLSNIIIFYNFVNNKDIKLGLSQKSQAAGEASQACRRNSRCLALWSGDLANYC